VRAARLISLLAALAGYWLPWLTHPAVALRLNGYELSEWVTFLPGVRDGSLPLNRLVFLLPLAGVALLCGLAAVRPPSNLTLPPLGATARLAPPPPRTGLAALLPNVAGPLGWALLAVGLACALIVFPPYPYLLTAYADPEFQPQLLAASLTLVALLVLLYLPAEVNALLQTGVAALAAALAVWGLATVRPIAADLLNVPWPLGLGGGLLLVGLAGLTVSGLAALFGPRQ
jgi:hypothetical protein